MKKNNETWLAFFKKSLKVMGIGTALIIIILGFVIYYFLKYQPDGRTYLDCEGRHYAFIESSLGGSLFFGWDPVELEWKHQEEITTANKQIIQAKFSVRPNDAKEGELYTPEIAYLTFDRVEGSVKLKFEDKEKETFKYKCIKISKRDLPTKEIKQKF